MANYATLKSAIRAAIKQNGNNEITGNLLQAQLLSMINSLGDGYQFMGVATPDTVPGTPDIRSYYIAGPGSYPNFDNVVVQDGQMCIFSFATIWTPTIVDLEVKGYSEIDIIHSPFNRGIIFSSGNFGSWDTANWRGYAFDLSGGQIKKIIVGSYCTDTIPAAIAFYSTDHADPGSYMQSASVRMTTGFHYYSAEVPAGAKYVVVCGNISNSQYPPELYVKGDYDSYRHVFLQNLFSIKNAKPGYITAGGSYITPTSDYEFVSDYIPVTPNEIYTLATVKQIVDPWKCFALYTADKAFIQRITITANATSLVIPNNCAYIRVAGRTRYATWLYLTRNVGCADRLAAEDWSYIYGIGNKDELIPARLIIGSSFISSIDFSLDSNLALVLTIPADTLIATQHGYYPLNAGTYTIPSIGTGALKLYFDINSASFGVVRYNSNLPNGVIYIAAVRTNLTDAIMAVDCSFPHTLNGGQIDMKNSFIERSSFYKSVNHRGYYIAPENTIIAYEFSKRYGFEYVETDIWFTSDNVPVLLHDETINRTARNADGSEISTPIPISSITYQQALTYDFGIYRNASYAGTKIPTAEQFFTTCRNLGLRAYVELKAGTQAQITNLIRLIEDYGLADKFTIISFTLNLLQFAHAANDKMRIGVLWGNTFGQDAINAALSLKDDNEVFMDAQWGVSQTEINLCKNARVPLEIWLVNSASDFDTLDKYVSRITTDNFLASRYLASKL